MTKSEAPYPTDCSPSGPSQRVHSFSWPRQKIEKTPSEAMEKSKNMIGLGDAVFYRLSRRLRSSPKLYTLVDIGDMGRGARIRLRAKEKVWVTNSAGDTI